MDPTALKTFFASTRTAWVAHDYAASPQDSIAEFAACFFNLFPGEPQAACDKALNEFLDDFFREGVLHYAQAKEIIARHRRIMELLGRDPLELAFYKEQARVFGLAKLQNSWFRAELGQVFTCIASDGHDGWGQMNTEARQSFRHKILKATPAERAAFLADRCRLGLRPATAKNNDWRNAGLNVRPWTLPLSSEEEVALFQQPIEPSPEQACVILEYLCLHCDKYASNRPKLDEDVAHSLGKSLPRGRADLERLVKYTRYQTTDGVKLVLIDALRGTKRSWLGGLIRPLVASQSSLEDEPELWHEWIAAKRAELLAAAASRKPYGRAADRPGGSDWDLLRGQVYDLDVVGYAKRIARSQSGGADVRASLEDLRDLAATIRANLAALEATLPNATRDVDWEQVMPLPGAEDVVSGTPSLYGLLAPPTDLQLAVCDARTLHAVDRLVSRIELLDRHPALIIDDEELWLRTDENFSRFYYDFYQTKPAAVFANGRAAPEGLLERLDGLSFEMLDGPYIVDTEPSFTEIEYKSWRWSIWMLAYLPPEQALARLEALASTMFRGFLGPNQLHGRIGQGYRRAELAGAVITAAMKLPNKSGLEFFDWLIDRTQDEALLKSIGEQRTQLMRSNKIASR